MEEKVIKVFAGVALVSALTFGVAVKGTALYKEVKYNNTQINYNGMFYDLGDLYLISSENEKELCYLIEIDSQTKTSVTVGIKVESGEPLLGISQSTLKTYGYISVKTDKLVVIRGLEAQFGYNVEKIKDFIPYEIAEENNFKFSEEEFENLVPDINNKQR